MDVFDPYILVSALVLIGILLLIPLLSRSKHDTEQSILSLFQTHKYQEALAILKKEQSKSKYDPKWIWYIAQCYEKMGQIVQAIPYYKTLKEMTIGKQRDSNPQSTSNNFFILASHQLAGICQKLDKVQEAFGEYYGILQHDPTDKKANNVVGYTLMAQSQFNLALPYIKSMKIAESDNTKHKISYIICLIHLSNYKDAMQVLLSIDVYREDVLSINLHALYLYLYALEKDKQGIDYFNSISLKSSHAPDALLLLVHSFFFLVSRISEEAIGAVMVQDMIQTNPGFDGDGLISIYYYLALVYYKQNKPERSLSYVKEIQKNISSFLNLETIQNFLVDKDNMNMQKFSVFYEMELNALFSDAYLLKLGGFDLPVNIDISAYFDNIEVKKEYTVENWSLEELKQAFSQLSLSQFIQCTSKIIYKMGYIVATDLSDDIADGKAYLCVDSVASKRIILFFRQLPSGAHVSDIVIGDLVEMLDKEKVNQLIFISNGVLSAPAQELILRNQNIVVIRDSRLHTLLAFGLSS